jgi:hypothetical protein
VEREEDQDQYVYNRLPVETQGPVRFLVLVKEEIAGQYLDAEKDNKANAAYSVKKPDKHGCSLALFSSNHIMALATLSRVFRRDGAVSVRGASDPRFGENYGNRVTIYYNEENIKRGRYGRLRRRKT